MFTGSSSKPSERRPLRRPRPLPPLPEGLPLRSPWAGPTAISLTNPPPSAHFVLIESLLTYPYNWSAWLDLSDLCLDDPAVHPDVEDRLRPISGHWMYHFFCVHVFLENQANENAIAVIERLVNGNAGEEDDEYYADDEDEDRQENDAEQTRATARQRLIA